AGRGGSREGRWERVPPRCGGGATRTPPPVGEPPLAASQAMYTRSRNREPVFRSVVIIGLSLKWFCPPEKEKKVGVQVLPASVERATASSVPLMLLPWPLLKKTTMYP